MGKVFAAQSVSLDGFSAGPNVRMDNGMGDGGEALHEWMFHQGWRGGAPRRGARRPFREHRRRSGGPSHVRPGSVLVLGGASIVQQCLHAGLLSELRLHVVHRLLGGGTPFFGSAAPADLALERTRLIDAEGVSHFTFRVGSRN